MRCKMGNTDGTNFVQTGNIDIGFGHSIASSKTTTLQIENNAFTSIIEGVKTLLYRGKEYEFCQNLDTSYGDRSIFVRRLSNGLWTPWIWTGFNAQYGINQWDVCEYKGSICLMYIKNNLDLVVAYTQDIETWNQSVVLASNTEQVTCCTYKDFIYFIEKESGVYKLGFTDLFFSQKSNYTPLNSQRLSMRTAYNRILIFDASPANTSVQNYDGTTLSGWTNLSIAVSSHIDTAWILGQLYIVYRANATSYPTIAKLSNTYILSAITTINAVATDSLWIPTYIYNGKIYTGWLSADIYRYKQAQGITFPDYTDDKIIETNYITAIPSIIIQSDEILDEILYVPIMKNVNKYFRYTIKKYIPPYQSQLNTKHYYELELWTYLGDDTLVLRTQKYAPHRYINSII